MRRTKTQFAPLILLVALNCTKNKPTGATPAQGPSAQSVPQEVEPQESAQRTPAYGGGYGDPGKGGGKGDMPPEKGELEITITHLNSESWNNNCLSFGVGYVDKNGQSVETPLVRAGCSKDPDILNKKIILKGYAGVCNRVRFVLQSFPPDLTNCPHNSPCGHFQKHPKVVRSSKNPHDLIAFFAYNVAKNLPNNHFIQVKAFKRDLIADYEEAQSYSGGKVGGWIRILFEDQPTHNILEAINNPSSPT